MTLKVISAVLVKGTSAVLAAYYCSNVEGVGAHYMIDYGAVGQFNAKYNHALLDAIGKLEKRIARHQARMLEPKRLL